MATPGVQEGQDHLTPRYEEILDTTVHVQSKAGACSRTYEGLRGKVMCILSGLQVGIGCASIMFGVTAVALHANNANVSYGIWGGAFYIVAGAFGFRSSKHKTLCAIITSIVLSIIAAAITTAQLSLAVNGVSDERHNDYFYEYHYYDNGYSYSSYGTKRIAARTAMNAVLIFLAVCEALTAIVSVCLCCHEVCCCRIQCCLVRSGGHGIQYVALPQSQMGAQPSVQTVPVVMPQGWSGNQPGLVFQPQATGGLQTQPYNMQAVLVPVYNQKQPNTTSGDNSRPPSYSEGSVED